MYTFCFLTIEANKTHPYYICGRSSSFVCVALKTIWGLLSSLYGALICGGKLKHW